MVATTNDNPDDYLNYKFSRAELKALEECNYESFVQRSLPLATLSAAGAWYAVKTGIMKGSPKYGATPKVLVASTIGFFLGKFSYQSKCAEKLMQIPDSKIGKVLRERQGKSMSPFGGFGGEFDPGFGSTFGSFSGSSSSTAESNEPQGNAFSDHAPNTYSDLNTDRPITNYDDSFSHNAFSQKTSDESLPTIPPPQQYTYEELRRKNREEYEQSKVKPYARAQPAAAPVQPQAQDDFRNREQVPASTPGPPPSWNKQRNMYGDVWEK